MKYFKTKDILRDIKTLHNNKGNNSTRGYNPRKYVPNIVTAKNIKQILMGMKGEIDRNIVIVGDFYTPFTSMDRSSQKIN